MKRRFWLPLIAAVMSLASVNPASAQAVRTWVSGVGDDANPCSRTAPCKTFAGAISKTAAAGEINVIDPGGFGAVTITKSISIVAEGQTAGIAASFINGIIINAAAADRIVLDGLDIEGFGNGLNGIRILNAGSVLIKNTDIRNFRGGTGIGIDIQDVTDSAIYVQDSTITGNLVGISVKNSTVPNRVFIDNTRIVENTAVSLQADGTKARATINASLLRGATLDLKTSNGGRINSYVNNNVESGTANGVVPVPFK